MSTSPRLLLCVRPDGAIECLHHDELDLETLGPVTVRRASHVEFDEETQQWYVEVAATGERVFTHPKRSRCLVFEAEYFADQLRAGLRPFQPTVDGTGSDP